MVHALCVSGCYLAVQLVQTFLSHILLVGQLGQGCVQCIELALQKSTTGIPIFQTYRYMYSIFYVNNYQLINAK